MKVLVVQPYLTRYRIPVFKEIGSKFDVQVSAAIGRTYGDFSSDDLTAINFKALKEVRFISSRIFWQSGLLSTFKKFMPDVVFVSANPRYLSMWVLLLASKFYGVKILLHGQGSYNKSGTSLLSRIQYKLFHLLGDRYICYTETCRNSLKNTAIYNKCLVAENSIVNDFPVEKLFAGECGLLFVGRLRHGCNLDLLIEAIIKLEELGTSLTLYIIGGGDLLDVYRKKYLRLPNVFFLGEVYNAETISKISQKCFAGCYPGDAGLSVLHYMSLSLPPIVHSSMDKHLGPEPSYVVEGENGVYFERESLDSLVGSIKKLYEDPSCIERMQRKSFSTYRHLTNPSLGQRMLSIINELIEANGESS
ncbi:MAG: glycosyltransferase family 4 protein [Gammaproteobacteria bacterium]|nr:glycosyltransferase family 4 protein [Gammaproteobacteria bacterium]